MCEEWTSLSDFENEDGSITLVGGVATVEPQDIQVRCNCPRCGTEFISDRIEVPAPNVGTDVDRESRRWNSELYDCSNDDCDFMFDIEINNGIGGMDIEINGVERRNISFRSFPNPPDDETG